MIYIETFAYFMIVIWVLCPVYVALDLAIVWWFERKYNVWAKKFFNDIEEYRRELG